MKRIFKLAGIGSLALIFGLTMIHIASIIGRERNTAGFVESSNTNYRTQSGSQARWARENGDRRRLSDSRNAEATGTGGATVSETVEFRPSGVPADYKLDIEAPAELDLDQPAPLTVRVRIAGDILAAGDAATVDAVMGADYEAQVTAPGFDLVSDTDMRQSLSSGRAEWRYMIVRRDPIAVSVRASISRMTSGVRVDGLSGSVDIAMPEAAEKAEDRVPPAAIVVWARQQDWELIGSAAAAAISLVTLAVLSGRLTSSKTDNQRRRMSDKVLTIDPVEDGFDDDDPLAEGDGDSHHEEGRPQPGFAAQ